MGYLKLVQREDEKQAAMAGLMTKQLTHASVEQHLQHLASILSLAATLNSLS